MLIRNKSSFIKGFLLLASFAIVFASIFMPIITLEDGRKENPLNYADDFFNSLSKGSAFFIPSVRERVIKDLTGKQVDITLHMRSHESAAQAALLAEQSGFTVNVDDKNLALKGDIFTLAMSSLVDAEYMYNNDEKAVSERWDGANGLRVLRTWHELFQASIKPLQRAGMIVEAQAVDAIVRRALEPSYNFFGITASRVADNVGMLTFLLVFYVVYTMWYGFAIFGLFEGIGLTMKKAAVKEEG